VATNGATLNRRSYGVEPFFPSPRCAGPAAGNSIRESRKDLVISARSFVTFVISRLFFQEACLETGSSSASSDFSAISASDFNISKLTFLLHITLAELKGVKEWQDLMHPKIYEVVEWLRYIRPHLTETVTHCATYELHRKLSCRSAV
jgi:hypothetical protein